MDGIVQPVKWLRKNLGFEAAAYDRRRQALEKRRGRSKTAAPGGDIPCPNRSPCSRARLAAAPSGNRQAGELISARLDFSKVKVTALLDSLGNALLDPPERRALPLVCRACPNWHTIRRSNCCLARLRLAEARSGRTDGNADPTRRRFLFLPGRRGTRHRRRPRRGTYPIDDLVFDLANIRAGPRFAGEDAPLGGRLGALCQRVYERADHPGYLEMGVPVHYGAGASEVIREVVTNPSGRYKMTSDSLRTATSNAR